MKKSPLVAALLLSIFLLSACGEHPDTIESGTQESSVEQVPPPLETISFPSLDSLEMFGNLYHKDEAAPCILLCHQAGFNKFEYVGIAPTLREMGYNVLAIDQRSGGPLIEAFNQTQQAAAAAGKPTDYLDAEQDIVAAVNYMREKYQQPVILWGSSYSSTLALYVGLENENVKAVVSFSPGDYFAEEKGSLKEGLKDFKKPMWVTSSKPEAPELTAMLSEMTMMEHQMQFIPPDEGKHGSRALWKTYDGNEKYWESLTAWLDTIK